MLASIVVGELVTLRGPQQVQQRQMDIPQKRRVLAALPGFKPRILTRSMS
jgi:hypothetical protein